MCFFLLVVSQFHQSILCKWNQQQKRAFRLQSIITSRTTDLHNGVRGPCRTKGGHLLNDKLEMRTISWGKQRAYHWLKQSSAATDWQGPTYRHTVGLTFVTFKWPNRSVR